MPVKHMYNRRIMDIFELHKKLKGLPTSGEVGIEIEVEGENLPRAINSYWTVHQDGSLRGESAEYVLRVPCKRSSVPQFLKYLTKTLNTVGAKVNKSNRTSVHVHLNIQQWQLRKVYSLFTLYFIIEDLLMYLAGESRIGNTFCLRGSDAEGYIERLRTAVKQEDMRMFTDENGFRYAALNSCAIPKFGSIEFRALHGTVDPDEIGRWVEVLLRIKDCAEQIDDPRTILQHYSVQGPQVFLDNIFGAEQARELKKLVGGQWINLLQDGMYRAQEIAYAVNWEIEGVVEERPRFFQTQSDKPRRHLDEMD